MEIKWRRRSNNSMGRIRIQWGPLRIIVLMSQFAKRNTLSLLCSLFPSLGLCFSPLTTYTSIHMMGVWTAQSKPDNMTTEMCRGLRNVHKGGHGWEHPDHRMVWISCGSHCQTTAAFKQTESCPRVGREVTGKRHNSGLLRNILWTCHGPDSTPASHRSRVQLVSTGPRTTHVAGLT